MPRVVYASPLDAFLDWNSTDQRFLQTRDELAIVSSGQYCHACGAKIPIGEKAYQVLAYYGHFGEQSKLVPIHAHKCIPAFQLEIATSNGEPFIFTNYSLSTDFLEDIGEMEVHTKAEAVEFTEFVCRFFSRNMVWTSYRLFQDGEVIQAENNETANLSTD